MQTKKKGRSKLLIFTLAAMLFVITLMCVFGFLMYRNHLYDVNSNLAKVYLSNTREKISYGVSFGKSIDKFYGMTSLLTDARNSQELLDSVFVLDTEGKAIYASEGDSYPQSAALAFKAANEIVVSEGSLYSSMALTDDSLMVARIDAQEINQDVNTFVHKMVTIAAIIYAGVALIMLIIALALRNAKSLHIILSAIMILAIASLGAYVGMTCWKEYQASYQELAQGVTNSIHQDIYALQKRGILYDELHGIDEYLQGYVEDIPEFENIVLTTDHDSSGQYSSSFSLKNEEAHVMFFVDSYVSAQYTQQALLQYVLNTILLSMVALLIIMEYDIFSTTGQKKEELAALSTPDAQEEKDYHQMSRMVRLFMFIMYACLKIGMSLDAIVARGLCGEGASSALIGLPTTTAMVGAICAVVLSPFLVRALKSLKNPLWVSAIMALGGLVLCAFAPSIYFFAAARFMTGFGEGLAAMLLKNIAAIQPSAERRKSFLAKASGGTFAGMCMGSVMGGMLNDQLSQTYVYLIGAAVLLLAIVLIPGIRLPQPKEEKSSIAKGMGRVLTHLPSLRYLICVVVPVYVCAVFLDYVLPLAGSDFGFSTTLISTLILAYSLIAGYAAPSMTKIAGKIFPNANSAALAYMILTGVVILLYPVFNSAIFLVIAIVMMGVCDSFGVVYLNEGFIIAGADKYDRNIGNTAFTMVCKGGSMIAPACIAFVGSYMALPIVVAIGVAGYAVTGVIGKAHAKKKLGAAN